MLLVARQGQWPGTGTLGHWDTGTGTGTGTETETVSRDMDRECRRKLDKRDRTVVSGVAGLVYTEIWCEPL